MEVICEWSLGRRGEAAYVADVVGHVGMDLQVGEGGGGEAAFLALVRGNPDLFILGTPRAVLDVIHKDFTLWGGEVTLAAFVDSHRVHFRHHRFSLDWDTAGNCRGTFTELGIYIDV